MGFVFRKRVRVGRRTALNLSRSRPSLSHRRGRLTVNSKGRASIRLVPGLSFRWKLW